MVFIYQNQDYNIYIFFIKNINNLLLDYITCNIYFFGYTPILYFITPKFLNYYFSTLHDSPSCLDDLPSYKKIMSKILGTEEKGDVKENICFHDKSLGVNIEEIRGHNVEDIYKAYIHLYKKEEARIGAETAKAHNEGRVKIFLIIVLNLDICMVFIRDLMLIYQMVI